ncbi:SGNH/GDSL hydrolase family protein [Allobranchiibius sp. CTAmp26]|uniref:SGNH/GDSL hydrolase family protein n=1 Tax=Allobranchiibius sp. CTAmp26 TaxID=2815214 RepID=UPI001AA15269|nr:SGNH/GDSL hydrolase family protein [Allobranchiibius sp. CTAmp26]MBO1753922.1 SGNH/GDSL hydrolase family protein [Allobranchiibius sp. CTAmp26]
MRTPARLSTLAGALATTLTLAALGATSAQAVTKTYVALGDSYSAGVGSGGSTDSTCYRSPYGYAPLIAKQRGLTLSYRACSGATTADVTTKQLGALTSGTSYVSMTIGGNDVGFANTITECAKPAWASDCAGSISAGRTILTTSMPGRYAALFSAIAGRATTARVAIGGYPHIFQGEDCNLATFFSPQDEQGINSATDDLDTLISTKARAAGFTYVDPRAAFTGHAVCDTPEWINGLSYPIVDSYHPNKAGNVGYATLFSPALTGSTYTAVRAAATASSGSYASGPTLRAQADRVLAMGLTAPATQRRARAAGVDPAEVTRLMAALHSSDTRTVGDALVRLHALDRHATAVLAARS